MEIKNNDTQYLDWLLNHPNGFLVNAERIPRAAYLVLHKATCASISRTKKPHGAWTERGYFKVCADSIAELEQWGRKQVGGTLRPCQRCKPV